LLDQTAESGSPISCGLTDPDSAIPRIPSSVWLPIERLSGYRLGFSERLYVPPLVHAVAKLPFGIAIGKAVQAHLALIRIASATALHGLDDPEPLKLSQARTYCVSVTSVLHELIVSRRQSPVFGATVASVFYIYAIQQLSRSAAQNAKRWRLQHRDRLSRELARNGVSSLARHLTSPRRRSAMIASLIVANLPRDLPFASDARYLPRLAG
jgi:hypothetical protein